MRKKERRLKKEFFGNLVCANKLTQNIGSKTFGTHLVNNMDTTTFGTIALCLDYV